MSTDSPTPPARPATIGSSLQAATNAALDRLEALGFSRRLWQRDATLWKQDPEHQEIICNSLGWLTVADTMLKQVDVVEGFAQEVRSAGFTDQVVLGMGGSSLCSDVCRATFGTRPGFLQLHVLDSTDPASVAAVGAAIDPARALFVVSSKSGKTIETASFFQYFFYQLRTKEPGENFVAITDPGTPLEELAREKHFRRVFLGQPDIGGRYSALSSLAWSRPHSRACMFTACCNAPSIWPRRVERRWPRRIRLPSSSARGWLKPR